MRMFLFHRIDRVSSNYHEEGGLVIVARDEAHARELIGNDEYIKPTDEEWGKAVAYDLSGDPEPKVYVFPDAGCC